MEDWSNPMNENDGSREIFLYGSSSSSVLELNCSSGGFFRSVVKTEATTSTNHGHGHGHGHGEYSLNGPTHEAFLEHHRQEEANKAKILAHPRFSNLLQAFLDCQVGAPPGVMERLVALRQPSPVTSIDSSKDPELDQFMEAYCNMLVKYKEALTTPFQEAMDFTRTIETQLKLLTNGAICTFHDEKCEGVDSSEEDQESGGGGETRQPEFDPRAEDKELKNQLMKKYSGCLSSLKHEFSKKRKKGKLPKEARQKLLNWWELHYKWPYPSETEKVALAESTGLDEKQINNWFINQRKRHWKPAGDMHFMVMDAGLYRSRP